VVKGWIKLHRDGFLIYDIKLKLTTSFFFQERSEQKKLHLVSMCLLSEKKEVVKNIVYIK
jgi:hypothetical protein